MLQYMIQLAFKIVIECASTQHKTRLFHWFYVYLIKSKVIKTEKALPADLQGTQALSRHSRAERCGKEASRGLNSGSHHTLTPTDGPKG